MNRTIGTDVSYIAFVLGYDFLHDILDDSMMATDEAYDYCVELAEEFLKSEYDDDCEPVYECIENFANDKMPDIEKYIEGFNESLGGCIERQRT